VQVNGATGLRRRDVDCVAAWLAAINDRPPPLLEAGEDDVEVGSVNVGDPVLMKTRRLSRMCSTCIFRPGNFMRLRDGRLRDIVAEARTEGTYIVCHSTLPGMAPHGVDPAICRGFADRYSTQTLQVLERLFGFIDVEPPEQRTD
jgi:hypothetical protein